MIVSIAPTLLSNFHNNLVRFSNGCAKHKKHKISISFITIINIIFYFIFIFSPFFFLDTEFSFFSYKEIYIYCWVSVKEINLKPLMIEIKKKNIVYNSRKICVCSSCTNTHTTTMIQIQWYKFHKYISSSMKMKRKTNEEKREIYIESGGH